ncbi:hypothetical protein [Stappia albiluteola]|uniref:hypothetical protein n=1 Tax=Stappia albiluteola TaxID=2758565 RepID=UPI001AD8A1A8|nr:hypothetical protein [Stappia albiluteola]
MLPEFDKSIFINCPFDEEYAPILQAIAFCVVYLGFFPRLAPENADNGAARLDRIIDLIENSRYGIHDLSRCKSTNANQYFRMNMPFELGMDHACKRFGGEPFSSKAILVLEHTKYDYQKSLSDISGWDIEYHEGDYEKAVKRVRNWLVAQAGAQRIGASLILGKYIAFQEWYWERERAAGASEDDIREYPTTELIIAMRDWMGEGQPLG